MDLQNEKCVMVIDLQKPPPELPFGCMADYGQTNIPKDLRPEADPHSAPVRRSFSSYLIFPHRPHHRVFRIRDV